MAERDPRWKDVDVGKPVPFPRRGSTIRTELPRPDPRRADEYVEVAVFLALSVMVGVLAGVLLAQLARNLGVA